MGCCSKPKLVITPTIEKTKFIKLYKQRLENRARTIFIKKFNKQIYDGG